MRFSFSWESKSWFAQVIISLLLLTVTSDLLDVNDRLVDSVATVVIDVIFYLQCQVCFERCISSLLQNSHVTSTSFFITNTNISIKAVYK